MLSILCTLIKTEYFDDDVKIVIVNFDFRAMISIKNIFLHQWMDRKAFPNAADDVGVVQTVDIYPPGLMCKLIMCTFTDINNLLFMHSALVVANIVNVCHGAADVPDMNQCSGGCAQFFATLFYQAWFVVCGVWFRHRDQLLPKSEFAHNTESCNHSPRRCAMVARRLSDPHHTTRLTRTLMW
jgi:hypothetical protein